jgi:hypothetical protein
MEEKTKIEITFPTAEHFKDFRKTIRTKEKLLDLVEEIKEEPQTTKELINSRVISRPTFWRVVKVITQDIEKFERDLGIRLTERSRFQTPTGRSRLEFSRSSNNLVIDGKLGSYIIVFKNKKDGEN